MFLCDVLLYMGQGSEIVNDDYDEAGNDNNDDIYIMMKCLCVCHEK